MERKPLPTTPAMATDSPPATTAGPEVLEWEQPLTTKKGLFSKLNLFGASTKPKEPSIEEGTVKPIPVEKDAPQSPATRTGFLGRISNKMLIIGVVALLLLILILGLGLGLGLKKKS